MSKVTVNAGSSLNVLLAVLFIGLKLTGYINWSWVWVVSPLWIPLALVCVFLLFCFIAALLGAKIK